jgi:sn-glycerol 3-phosphate transport system ATP-binding protein
MNLLAGTLEAGTVRLGEASWPAGGQSDGPSHHRHPPRGLPARRPRVRAFSASVDYVEELGATRLVHGRVGGQPLTWLWAAGEDVPDVVSIAAPPAAVHLFDRETGKRLD